MHLSKTEFLEHKLIREELRSSHRAIITNNHSLKTVGDIVDFFRNPKYLEQIVENFLIESPLDETFKEPLNLNFKFWNCGNNYFLNCVRFGFREGVVPYKRANSYIGKGSQPLLYSADYYQSLPEMNDSQIELFLRENPIGVTDGVIIHGIHRSCAMINRLIRNQEYIPLFLGKGC